jgi:spoIIIJ-associated protein
MTGFLKKLFGIKKSEEKSVEMLIDDTIGGICEMAQFDLSFTSKVTRDGEEFTLNVDFSGPDEELLKDRKGQLLDAFQLLIKRIVQHHFSDLRINVNVDCSGYREESNAALIERAENLKTIAIEQQKAVYYRALPPKERKIVHQYLAQDTRVKSRSLGDGLYKKIKIFPAKSSSQQTADPEATQE